MAENERAPVPLPFRLSVPGELWIQLPGKRGPYHAALSCKCGGSALERVEGYGDSPDEAIDSLVCNLNERIILGREVRRLREDAVDEHDWSPHSDGAPDKHVCNACGLVAQTGIWRDLRCPSRKPTTVDS